MANKPEYDLERALNLVERLRGELKYVHETGDVHDSIQNSAGDLEDADHFLIEMGRAVPGPADEDAPSPGM